mmetsp:Transcript_17370/g.26338  ORF Transcript_17370/g.26338 Transcript_17370/m.26338 type:complete len:603 (-) Transcript_17370:33-1841(-)
MMTRLSTHRRIAVGTVFVTFFLVGCLIFQKHHPQQQQQQQHRNLRIFDPRTILQKDEGALLLQNDAVRTIATTINDYNHVEANYPRAVISPQNDASNFMNGSDSVKEEESFVGTDVTTTINDYNYAEANYPRAVIPKEEGALLPQNDASNLMNGSDNAKDEESYVRTDATRTINEYTQKEEGTIPLRQSDPSNLMNSSDSTKEEESFIRTDTTATNNYMQKEEGSILLQSDSSDLMNDSDNTKEEGSFVRTDATMTINDSNHADDSTDNSALLAKLRSDSMAEAARMKCSKPITMHNSTPTFENPKYYCSYQHSLTEAYTCGTIQIPYDADPWVWQCRLKNRLFQRVVENQLKDDCAFGGMDVGAGNGNMVIGTGSFAPQSVYAAIEASPYTYEGMYKNLAANPGLVERVYAYNSAAGFYEPAADNEEVLSSSSRRFSFDAKTGSWNGPTRCVSSGPSIFFTESCPTSKVPVPILQVNGIMSDVSPSLMREGALLFLKIDVDDDDVHKVLLGARDVLTNLAIRPCFVYVKLKANNPDHEQALQLLRDEYGYSSYEDLDSGLLGSDSYPPKGAYNYNEGTYEFWLPDTASCTERVQKVSTLAA